MNNENHSKPNDVEMIKSRDIQEIFEAIKLERQLYKDKNKGIKKFFSIISTIFFFLGFAALIAVPFSFMGITIFHAASLFLISHCIEPTDGDRYEEMLKGMSEDAAHIRANLEFLNLNNRNL